MLAHKVKPVLSGHSKRMPDIGFQYRLSLNAGQKFCRMLQYFRPPLSYHFLLRPWFCLFLSGRLRQVLLYVEITQKNHLRENSEFFSVSTTYILIETEFYFAHIHLSEGMLDERNNWT